MIGAKPTGVRTTRALVCRELAGDFSALRIEERTLPPPAPGEVQVRLRAASLNFPDLLMTQGTYQLKPELPFTPGMEGAGEVIKVAAGVSGINAGDAVVVTSRFGILAEEVNLPAAAIRPKHDSMDWAQAAAYPVAWLTAYVALARCGALRRDETLLVLGAAGGTGMAAVDLALSLGAQVVAAAGSDEKRAALKARGVHHVIDHRQGFRDQVKLITDGRGADVIFDPIGGDAFDESIRCIAFGGRLLVVGFASGRIPSIAANMPLIKGFSIVGVRAGEYGRQFPDRGQENIAAIEQMAQQGKIRPHVGLSLPFEQAVEAFRALAARRVVGKAVLTF